MATMGYREYARHRGVTLRAVQKAIEAGRIRVIQVDGKPKIDSDQADRDWIENTDPAKQSLLYSAGPVATDTSEGAEAGTAAGPGAAPPPAAPGMADEVEPKTPADEDLPAYRRERAARESINRERDQLALDKERGKLVDREEVARLRFTEFRALRDALGNLGARIKDALAAETDPLRCEHIVDEEKDRILADFADKVLTRGVMSDGDEDDDD